MWRSLLFIPVLEERFIKKAAARGADAIVLDLEAGIADDRKDEARKALPAVVKRLAPDVTVTVRINPLWMAAVRDLEACVIPGVQAIHLALCESAEYIRAIDGLLTELETERGLAAGSIKLIAMVESADALLQSADIARASSRLTGLTLGVEDYATSMGTAANADLLRPAALQVIQAARAAGIYPVTVPASMADFSDLNAFESAAVYARRLGSVGGYAVHPAQIAVLNQVFSPTEKEIAWAQRVLSAEEQAQRDGKGAFKVDGQMIDKPLIDRARMILGASETDCPITMLGNARLKQP